MPLSWDPHHHKEASLPITWGGPPTWAFLSHTGPVTYTDRSVTAHHRMPLLCHSLACSGPGSLPSLPGSAQEASSLVRLLLAEAQCCIPACGTQQGQADACEGNKRLIPKPATTPLCQGVSGQDRTGSSRHATHFFSEQCTKNLHELRWPLVSVLPTLFLET